MCATMIYSYCLLVFILFTCSSSSPVDIIHNVTDSSQLESILCTDNEVSFRDDVTLLLHTNVTHKISQNKYCRANISHSLNIISSSSDGAVAHIQCMTTNLSMNWTSGFAFYGSNGSLTMRGLHFNSCGTYLTILDSDIISTSYLSFSASHGIVLLLSNIANVQVTNITIFNYTGFAILTVNLPNASFDFLNVSYFAHNHAIYGSGLFVLYTNLTTHSAANDSLGYYMQIRNSTFHMLHSSYKKDYPYPQDCTITYRCPMPALYGAGLTIYYTQSLPAVVNISNSKFESCQGLVLGTMTIMQFNSSISSRTIIRNSYFLNNLKKHLCLGAAITGNFYFSNSGDDYSNDRNITYYTPLTVTGTNFSSNGINITHNRFHEQESGTIGISIYTSFPSQSHSIPVQMYFANNTFYKNTAFTAGNCILMSVIDDGVPNAVLLILESIIAYKNRGINYASRPTALKNGTFPLAAFYFSKVNKIIINGSDSRPGNFTHNYGSVFQIIGSNATLQGNLKFINNIANRGSAFVLEYNSILNLNNGLNISFINNTAQSLGGAIYANCESCQSCTFQHFNTSSVSDTDISLYFANNTATLAGDAIYSSNLYNCSIAGERNESSRQKFYWKIFKNLSPKDISSKAVSVYFCNNETGFKAQLYPGASLHIPVSVYDSNNTLTYDTVTVIPVESVEMQKLDWQFSTGQGSMVIKGRDNCTMMNLTILTTDKSTFNKSAMLLFTITEQDKVFEVQVQLNDCPIGFILHETKGACVCSQIFKHISEFKEQKISCDIEKNAFSKPFDLHLWIGKTNARSGGFGVAYCNPSYCNTGSQFDLLKVNKSGSYLLSSVTNDTIPLCYGSRTGAFCGECITDYSVVFGSRECKSCTSVWWLLTSIIYLLAGPLLVFLLYTFRLTLTTGTLNGIIFYAQTANIGIMRYLSMPCSDCGKESFFVTLSKLFIAWLNLNLGLPLCFYDGMTELWKAGLSLLFPVYLILIIAFLVLLSHFSTRVSNKLSKSSVQVLVTIVHLSFTKLLEAVIDVFGSAKVYEEVNGEKIVWYNSGAVDYGSTEHMWLMIVTSLVVGIILIPYFVLILFGKFLLKFDRVREYIRPFYEAIHAPYKPNRWYWFSLYQFFLLLVYLSETFAGNTGPMFLVLFILYNVFIYLQTCSMPFRNKALNLLNLSLLLALNFVIVVGVYIYFIRGYTSKYLVLFFNFSNYFFILIFCLIMVYHVLLCTNRLDKVIVMYRKVSSFRCRKEPVARRSEDYPQVREPLLEDVFD